MKKQDFPFVIGYHTDTALVDKNFKSSFKNKTVKMLVDDGQYKAAYCLALYENNHESMSYIADEYNRISGASYRVDQLNRLFGVFSVPDITKIRGL